MRLYDRGPAYPLKDYVDLFIASQEIVIGALQTTVRFVQAGGKALAGADAAIAQGEEFYLEAEYANPPKDCPRTIALDTGADAPEEIPLTRSEENPRVCRSEYIRVEKPGL